MPLGSSRALPLRSIQVWAPANIAWVKYMGKADSDSNLPANPSLSMTLEGLGTETWAERTEESQGRLVWRPMAQPGRWIPEWSPSAWGKLERQLEQVWESGSAIVRSVGLPWSEARPGIQWNSSNTFPTASGIASSASGMAAFTLATLRIYCGAGDSEWMQAWDSSVEFRRAVAALSRRGSGSSCRSFEGPWVLWNEEHTLTVQGLTGSWVHRVVIVDAEPKRISSSEAHARVLTSSLWAGRPARARKRLERIQEALRLGDRATLASEVWQESWEMHSLFHTSVPPFSYWEPLTLAVLRWLEPRVADGACVATMDAGPNIHVTLPEVDAERWDAEFAQAFPQLTVMRDRPGHGVRWKGQQG